MQKKPVTGTTTGSTTNKTNNYTAYNELLTAHSELTLSKLHNEKITKAVMGTNMVEEREKGAVVGGQRGWGGI